MLYISYIINIFYTLYMICINYMFLFPSCKNLPCAMLISCTVLYKYYQPVLSSLRIFLMFYAY